MSEANPGAGRPPGKPPERISLGGAGGHEGGAAYIKGWLERLSGASYGSNLEGIMATLDRYGPTNDLATWTLILKDLKRQRAEIAEQIELELLVKRPSPKGSALSRPSDDHPVALENALKFVDEMIGEIEGSLESQNRSGDL